MATRKKSTSKEKTATKKTASNKPVGKKTAEKKAPAKKRVAKKPVVKKAVVKKAVVKKPVVKKKPAVAATHKKVAKKAPTPRKKPAEKTPATATKSPASSKARSTSRRSKTGPVTTITVIEGIAPYQEQSGEEYMNEAQTEHFRQILMAWKRELMEEVDRTVHHMQDEAANFPDPNDRATQESEFSMELRTRDRERKLIKKIDEALEKLDHEDYGYCEACGVEIGIRRLEARPTAGLCIDCKTLDEIREKQMGG
jgi:DnaK suppressor protein